MDTASLMGVIGSFDVGSLTPVLTNVTAVIQSVFSVISAAIDVAVSGSVSSAGSIQTVLGSVAGQ
ncbi:hypothetical protein [Rhodococcus sp. WS3]|uniref:hypothetical protein n=1 Tax=Rhodococcus sp. WS3 TaxID=2486271 RepID=UPI001144C538|nr:hypothetical protein [Rhodococcus sp. WS3]